MEEKDVLNGSGLTIKGDEAPQSLQSSENLDPSGGSTAPPSSAAPANVTAAPPPPMAVKKKRGRPRKYTADWSIVALSPMPISASIPLAGDYSTWKHSLGSSKKKHKLDLESPGEMMAYSCGAGFIPHVITVNPGEDVTKKIISFSQQGTRAICILAANGTISNVTLRQVNSSGGTLTYEGCFEILSLTGSFMPNDNGLTKSRTGGMSIALAGQDCRVLGGGLAGMLVAAGPVQVVIGSFLLNHHQADQKPKKPKYEQTISFASSAATNPISVLSPQANTSKKMNLTTSNLFNNLASTNSVQRSINTDHCENDVSLANED